MYLRPEHIKVGDLIKATSTAGTPHRTGTVLRQFWSLANQEPGFEIQESGTGKTHRALHSMRQYSGGIEGPALDGDVIIGTPTGLRGMVLRAEVTASRTEGLTATTLQTLDRGGYPNTEAAFTYRQDQVHIVQRPQPSAPAAQDLATRYPTPYHLKAAIWDLARAKYTANEWCDDVNGVLRELDIAGVSKGNAAALKVMSQELQNKVQRLWSPSLGISHPDFVAALKDLGLTPAPQTKRVRIEVEIPMDTTQVGMENAISRAVPELKIINHQEIQP
jgi:hypothetical protein